MTLFITAGILTAAALTAIGSIVYMFGYARGYDNAVRDHQEHAFEGHL